MTGQTGFETHSFDARRTRNAKPLPRRGPYNNRNPFWTRPPEYDRNPQIARGPWNVRNPKRRRPRKGVDSSMSSAWDNATPEEIEQALEAYDPNDPKHPDFASLWLDAIDRERKQAKEEDDARP